MKKRITDIIRIDSSLAVPVYKQIVQSIQKCIEQGSLSQNDMLPSVNSIAETFSLARGSVFTAYNDLRASGIIDSVPGKGYFVSSTRVNREKKILLLFNNFSCREVLLYNAIYNNLPADCTVDIYCYHDDNRVFEALINEQADRYNSFVIVPQIHESTPAILSKLEEKQTLLLGNGYKEYRKLFKGVFLDPAKIIYDILLHFKERVVQYKRLILVPSNSLHAKEFIAGFNKFSKKFSSNSIVMHDKDFGKIKKGDAFIILDDDNLVEIANVIKDISYHVGKDIGVISWSDNILKNAILNGITTAEIDFEETGKNILSMILTGKKQVVETPVVITDRGSF